MPEEGLHVRIGACFLELRRSQREWSLHHRYEGDPLDGAVEIRAGSDIATDETGSKDMGRTSIVTSAPGGETSLLGLAPPGDEQTLRAVVDATSEVIELAPRFADRSVVARPQRPLRLPAGQSAQLFVGTPLWVVVRVPRGPEMLELPLIVPTETWFGPSPVEGELCYSARTRAVASLEEVPRLTTRALTRVTLINRAPDAMDLERLRLPVPRLRLAWDESIGRFVTDDLELRREEDGKSANVEIKTLPPGVEVTAPPREPTRRSWNHALSALWA